MLKEIYSRIKGKDIVSPQDKKKTVNFEREIEQCLGFLEDKQQHKGDKEKKNLNYIHSNRIEFGRQKEGIKGHFFRREVLHTPGIPPYAEIFSSQNGRVEKTIISLMDNSILLKPEAASKQDILDVAEAVKNVKINL